MDARHDMWYQRHVATGFFPPATYLLIDDLHIERMERVRRVPGPVRKLPQPIIHADRPWEGAYVWAHNGMIHDADEGVFKLWYHANDPGLATEHPELAWKDRPAYAVSADGAHWEKPDLGVVDWKGSRRNNLVDFPPYGGDGPLGSVFKDPTRSDADRGYLAMGMARFRAPRGTRPQYWYHDGGYHDRRPRRGGVPITCGFYVYDSPNGFVWTRRPRAAMSNTVCTDNMMAHGYDTDLRKWIIWGQARTAGKFRTVGVSFADDLACIPFPQAALIPDEHDPPDCEFNHMVALKVPGGYAGLVVDFRPHEGCRKEPQLAFSRDARAWSRPAGRAPFIPAGEPGSWDEMNVFVHHPIAVGDDVFIPYHGSITGNGAFFPEHRRGRTRYVRVGGWGTPLPDGRMNLPGIGLATLKRDRWAAIGPVARSGVLHTRRLYWAGRHMTINADARGGSIRIELRDHHGRPVPGCTWRESDPFTGDGLEHRASWRGRRLLPAAMVGTANAQGTVGRLMSIHFRLERARLYAFAC